MAKRILLVEIDVDAANDEAGVQASWSEPSVVRDAIVAWTDYSAPDVYVRDVSEAFEILDSFVALPGMDPGTVVDSIVALVEPIR